MLRPSSTATCFSKECREPTSERRRGWRLRNGEYAKLCGRCASVFEEGKFCDTFHSHVTGWRTCESCGKLVHCGCVVSAHAFVLLDAGGINCLRCERKTSILTQNPAWTSSPSLPISLADKHKDPFVRNWDHNAGASYFGTSWQGAHLLSCSDQTGLQQKRAYLGLNHEEKQSLCTRSGIPVSYKDESPPMHNSLASASRSETEKQIRASISQSQLSFPVFGNRCQSTLNNGLPLNSSGDIHLKNSKLQADRRRRNVIISSCYPNLSDQMRQKILGDYCPNLFDAEQQKILRDPKFSITFLFEKMLSASDAGLAGCMVLPKACAEIFFPPILEPEGMPLRVQDIKGQEWIFQFRFWPNNNSRMYVLEGITPCIQSLELKAGDTVVFSYSEPGRKLILGYRKAPRDPMYNRAQPVKPHNRIPSYGDVNAADPTSLWSKTDKSRYVAKEALTCKTSLTKRKKGLFGSKSKHVKLDTVGLIELKVTLEEAQGLLRPRVDHIPNVVLVEDFEFEEYEDAPVIGRPTVMTKASLGEDVQWVQCDSCCKWRRIPPDVLPPLRWRCSDNSWDVERSSCIVAQELSTEQLEEMISTINSAQCKKHEADKPDEDPDEASDVSPTTMTKDYVGRSSYSEHGELSIEQIQHVVSITQGAACKEKYKAAKLDSNPTEGSDVLDTCDKFTLLAEGKAVSTSAQANTTRHPCHKPCCSCVVCIQLPIGKGPKHIPTCNCSLCLTLRRDFQTMKSQGEGKKSETDTVQLHQALNSSQSSDKVEPAVIDLSRSRGLGCSSSDVKTMDIEGSDDVLCEKPCTVPSKGQIDLNIQPEPEEELFPPSNPRMIEICDDALHGTGQMIDASVNLERPKLCHVGPNNFNPGVGPMKTCNEPRISGKDDSMDHAVFFRRTKSP